MTSRALSNVPIIFWSWKDRPSFTMRGRQLVNAICARGLQAQVRVGPSLFALRDIKNSIIVCVKATPWFTRGLLQRNNKIIYDAIDFTSISDVPTGAHCVIAGSDHMKKILEKDLPSSTLVQTIYHHCDPHIQPHTAGDDELRLVYAGAVESSNFIRGEIPELYVVDFQREPNWRQKILGFNTHFSARLDPFKSVIKLANVAAMKALYLTGAEPGCVELLGKDYPYFLRDPNRLETVQEDVRRLKETYGDSTWKQAKQKIQSTHEQLTLDASAVAYEHLFDKVLS